MTTTETTTSSTAAGSMPEVLMFRAANVTGTQEIPVEVAPALPVRTVTESLSRRMSLPGDVGWALRDDQSSEYLDEDRTIGEQIGPGSRVTLVPRTHLGGGVATGD